MGIPRKLIRLIDLTLKESNVNVVKHEGLTEEVEMKRGVRQSDGLLAKLFNINWEDISLTRDCSTTMHLSLIHI